MHRGLEHYVSSTNKCTVISLCSCVFLSRLEGIWVKRRWLTFSECYFVWGVEIITSQDSQIAIERYCYNKRGKYTGLSFSSARERAEFNKSCHLFGFRLLRVSLKAFILPHFNFCSETWYFRIEKSAEKLEMVNKRALRFVFKDKSSSYQELCKRIDLSSLREQLLAKIWYCFQDISHRTRTCKLLTWSYNSKELHFNLRGTTTLDLLKIKSTTLGSKGTSTPTKSWLWTAWSNY